MLIINFIPLLQITAVMQNIVPNLTNEIHLRLYTAMAICKKFDIKNFLSLKNTILTINPYGISTSMRTLDRSHPYVLIEDPIIDLFPLYCLNNHKFQERLSNRFWICYSFITHTPFYTLHFNCKKV